MPADLAHVGPAATSPAKLAWGPLASATAPPRASTRSSITCTNYCHGQTLGEPGSIVTPIWTKVDGTQASCGTCHGSRPPDPSHLFHASPTILNLPCSQCHPAGYTIDSVGPGVVPIHVNGVVDTNAASLPDWNAGAVGPNGWTGHVHRRMPRRDALLDRRRPARRGMLLAGYLGRGAVLDRRFLRLS